jgi:hypothetical protein
MDADLFDTLTRFLTGPSSRRRMLRGAAAILGFGFTTARPGLTRAGQPEPCKFEYRTIEGRRVRGYGYADFPSSCTLCARSRDCGAAFPHCLQEYTSLTSGTRWDFTRTCGAYPQGVCGRVNACAPEVAQAGIAR